MTTKAAEYALSATSTDDYEPFVVGGVARGEMPFDLRPDVVLLQLVDQLLDTRSCVALRCG